MGNKIDWKEIPGITKGVIEELVKLPIKAGQSVFNYLKDNQSQLEKSISGYRQSIDDVVAGKRPNINVRPERQRVSQPGAPTTNAATPTFAGLSPTPSGDNTNYVPPVGTSSQENIDNAVDAGAREKNTFAGESSRIKEEDDKVKSVMSTKDGYITRDKLSSMSDKELSDMYKKIYGREPGAILKGQLDSVLLDRLKRATGGNN